MRKKSKISFIVMFIMFFSIFNSDIILASENSNKITTVKSNVSINGNIEFVLSDSKIIDNTLYLPMRSFYEGLNQEVQWDSKNKLAISTFILDEYKFKIGSNKVILNNKDLIIKNKILINNNKTYIPIEDVLELSGFDYTISNNSINIILPNSNLIKVGEKYIYNIFDIESYNEIFKNKEVVSSLYGRNTHIFYDDKKNIQLTVTMEDNDIVSIWTNTNKIEIIGIRPGTKADKRKIENISKYLSYYGYTIDIDLIKDLDEISFVGIRKLDDHMQSGMLKSTSAIEILYNEEILKGYEKLILGYLNNYRISNNLSPLDYDSKLSIFSKEHNEEMIKYNYFSHDSFDKKTYAKRVENIMIKNNYNSMAENIAAGIYSPEEVVNLWLNSKIHRDNILSNFNLVGINVEYGLKSRYGLYFTTNFARKN